MFSLIFFTVQIERNVNACYVKTQAVQKCFPTYTLQKQDSSDPSHFPLHHIYALLSDAEM